MSDDQRVIPFPAPASVAAFRDLRDPGFGERGQLISRPAITEGDLVTGYGGLTPAPFPPRRSPDPSPPELPIRLAVYVPTRGAIRPWLTWLAGRGWHVHRVGLAAYAHPAGDRGAGWVIGFAVSGEPVPSWWSLLRPYAGGRGRHGYSRTARRILEGAE